MKTLTVIWLLIVAVVLCGCSGITQLVKKTDAEIVAAATASWDVRNCHQGLYDAAIDAGLLPIGAQTLATKTKAIGVDISSDEYKMCYRYVLELNLFQMALEAAAQQTVMKVLPYSR